MKLIPTNEPNDDPMFDIKPIKSMLAPVDLCKYI